MLETLPLTRFALALAGTAVGAFLLLFGRRNQGVLLAVVAALLASDLLAAILGMQAGIDLILVGQWQAVLITLAVGALGLFIGYRYKDLGAIAIGFVAGVYLATFFDRIVLYLIGRTELSVDWWLLALFILAGIGAAYLTRRDPDEALILISVLMGTTIISGALNLNQESSLTAVIILSLTLLGIVFQFATYVREQPQRRRMLPPVPAPDSDDLPYELP